jgi:hypothetical protein
MRRGTMGTGIATQLITVAATLSGVVLTLAANAYLQIRTARETRMLESLRFTAEHGKWLRDQRVKAYGELSTVTEEVLQFLRTDLPESLNLIDADKRLAIEGEWRKLRVDFRKSYNMVALFGAGDARIAAQRVWRTGRNAGNDFFHDLKARPDTPDLQSKLQDQLATAVSELGTSGEDCLTAFRADLQALEPPHDSHGPHKANWISAE